jgi:predicted RNase H-like HicB family nuclease
VLAQWDGEAGVWVAESEDVPGLVAEADSTNVLVQKLRTLIPELLELNGVPNDLTASFHVLYQDEDSEVLTF